MEITSSKFRDDIGAVLDAVLKGQTIAVTRRGRRVAILVPPDMWDQIQKTQNIHLIADND